MDFFRAKSVEQSITEAEEPEHRSRKDLTALDPAVAGPATAIFFADGYRHSRLGRAEGVPTGRE